MKAKLGISVGLLGAIVCLVALFGGITPTVLLVGYVLLCEENEWLKKYVVKALVVLLTITTVIVAVGLIPEVLSWFVSILGLFEGGFDYSFISRIISIITNALDIIRTALLLLLGVKALNQGNVSIPVVDDIIAKYM